MSEHRDPDPIPSRPRAELPPRRPPGERIPRRRPDDPADRTIRAQPIPTVISDATSGGGHLPPSRGGRGLAVPWWGFVIVILVVAGITCGMWIWVLTNRSSVSTATGPTPTPIFVVITSTPTLGSGAPDPTSGPARPALPTEAQATATVAVPALAIEVGGTVEVFGTEGDGLAVRQGPGRDFSYFFVGNEGERFLVGDGPRDADDLIWWYIVDPIDSDRAGWAADLFLRAVAP